MIEISAVRTYRVYKVLYDPGNKDQSVDVRVQYTTCSGNINLHVYQLREGISSHAGAQSCPAEPCCSFKAKSLKLMAGFNSYLWEAAESGPETRVVVVESFLFFCFRCRALFGLNGQIKAPCIISKAKDSPSYVAGCESLNFVPLRETTVLWPC